MLALPLTEQPPAKPAMQPDHARSQPNRSEGAVRLGQHCNGQHSGAFRKPTRHLHQTEQSSQSTQSLV
eukprot:4755052-Alexandrium_andersonii.AAC.1